MDDSASGHTRSVGGFAVALVLAVVVGMWAVDGGGSSSPSAVAMTGSPRAAPGGEQAPVAGPPIRDAVPVVPAADWRFGLRPSQQRRCEELLAAEDTAVVLVRVGRANDYTTLFGGSYRSLRVHVLDGAPALGIARGSVVEVCWRQGGGNREVEVGDVFFAVVTNADPVAKMFGLPPRLRELAFAGTVLPDAVAGSTAAAAARTPLPSAQPQVAGTGLLEASRRAGK